MATEDAADGPVMAGIGAFLMTLGLSHGLKAVGVCLLMVMILMLWGRHADKN